MDQFYGGIPRHLPFLLEFCLLFSAFELPDDEIKLISPSLSHPLLLAVTSNEYNYTFLRKKGEGGCSRHLVALPLIIRFLLDKGADITPERGKEVNQTNRCGAH